MLRKVLFRSHFQSIATIGNFVTWCPTSPFAFPWRGESIRHTETKKKTTLQVYSPFTTTCSGNQLAYISKRAETTLGLESLCKVSASTHHRFGCRKQNKIRPEILDIQLKKDGQNRIISAITAYLRICRALFLSDKPTTCHTGMSDRDDALQSRNQPIVFF